MRFNAHRRYTQKLCRSWANNSFSIAISPFLGYIKGEPPGRFPSPLGLA
nr:MAG TPA: hypothetical protein [Caudoviricetes sp.]